MKIDITVNNWHMHLGTWECVLLIIVLVVLWRVFHA